jgi:hypothetical protein
MMIIGFKNLETFYLKDRKEKSAIFENKIIKTTFEDSRKL